MDKLTPKQREALKELDAAVYAGTDVRIETQFGEIGIRRAGILGFAAELGPDAEFPEDSAYGDTPSTALLKLRLFLFLKSYKVARPTVLSFPARKCRLCQKPLRHGMTEVHVECARIETNKDELEAA
jgi:hypothetical protein